MTVPTSPNFAFIAKVDPTLVELASLAESYFARDPNTCLIKLRQFGEHAALRIAAAVGVYATHEDSQIDRINALYHKGVLTEETRRIFHGLRAEGNKAVHGLHGSHRDALHQLKMARTLGVWFVKTMGARTGGSIGPFIPPPDPDAEAREAFEELEVLRVAAAKRQAEVDQLRKDAEQAAALVAEHKAHILTLVEESDVWRELAHTEGEEAAALRAEIAELETQAQTAQAHALNTPAEVSAIIHRAQSAGAQIDHDEAATRHIIDEQLRDAGWEADSPVLRYGQGTRPEKHRNLAIAEWPTATGPADYALFVGLTCVAIVEAKRIGVDIPATLPQAMRYATSATLHGDATYAPGAPWQDAYVVPFVFATNSRPFLQQYRTKSGIWFRDLRKATHAARPLNAWKTPKGLLAELQRDAEVSHAKLKAEDTEYLKLRPYQVDAIQAVEGAIEAGHDHILLAMATGTGKTRTAIGLCYRLLKAQRFRRILFLVDRTALGIQAQDAFRSARLENLQTFTDVFNMSSLDDTLPEAETRLQVATVQGMVKRILYPSDPADVPDIDDFDCIIIDESHRGYNLDGEMSELELGFRSQNDYVSTYRRVLDHFDAVRIGLTATPAKHTIEIFGEPAFEYTYTQAVVDGFLVPYDPPLRITTQASRDGISFTAGSAVQHYNPTTQTIALKTLPDDVNVELPHFNQAVITRPFNKAICEHLANHISPHGPDKTLFFAVDNAHADILVDVLREVFHELDPDFEDEMVCKITGSVDRPLQQIRNYRNEPKPNIVVTVDLLTTGVDVPAITNIVFVRRVRSRILYDQMMGRATRLCNDLYGNGQHKEAFKIFDAVGLYGALRDYSEMKPVVTRPDITFSQLCEELQGDIAQPAKEQALREFITKLRRKARSLPPPARQAFKELTGDTIEACVTVLGGSEPDEAAAWLQVRPGVVELLDEPIHTERWIPIHTAVDPASQVQTELALPGGKNPGDYLRDFGDYLRTHINDLPALTVVTQRPKELTRDDLKALRLALAQQGYTERALRAATAQASNKDIAASIMGFIRREALGEALVPYNQRVDDAVQRMLAKGGFNRLQRDWLLRIAKQLKTELVVDHGAFMTGAFASSGGFKKMNRIFDERLDAVLDELHAGVWEDVG